MRNRLSFIVVGCHDAKLLFFSLLHEIVVERRICMCNCVTVLCPRSALVTTTRATPQNHSVLCKFNQITLLKTGNPIYISLQFCIRTHTRPRVSKNEYLVVADMSAYGVCMFFIKFGDASLVEFEICLFSCTCRRADKQQQQRGSGSGSDSKNEIPMFRCARNHMQVHVRPSTSWL